MCFVENLDSEDQSDSAGDESQEDFNPQNLVGKPKKKAIKLLAFEQTKKTRKIKVASIEMQC